MPNLNYHRKWFHDVGGIEQEAGEALMDEIDRLQAERDGLAAQVQAIRVTVQERWKYARFVDQDHYPMVKVADVDAILAQSPADALAAHDAKVRAQVLRDAADEIRHHQHPESIRQMLRARAAREDDTNGDRE